MVGSLGERCVDEIPLYERGGGSYARIACDSSGLRCTLCVERVAMSQRKQIHRRSDVVDWRGIDLRSEDFRKIVLFELC